MAARALLLAGILLATALTGCAAPDEPPVVTTTTRPVTTLPPTTTVTTTTTLPPTTTTLPPTTTTAPPTDEPDTPPRVTEIEIRALGETFVQVAWNVTDDGSVVSRVEYGPGDYSRSTPDLGGTGVHIQAIAGLSSCTTYKFRVSALDNAGQSGIGLPEPGNFTTNGTKPTVKEVQVDGILQNSVMVRWNVTGPQDVVTRVEYGPVTGETPAPTFGLNAGSQTGPGLKSFRVAGLAQDTLYSFRVRATSPCGDVVGPVIEKRTARVVHVDIKGLSGSANSFSPGSTVSGPLELVAGRPYVFEVTNMDSMAHTFDIQGTSPAYKSGLIAAGQTFTFPASVTLAAGDHHMRCSQHATGPQAMDGIIRVR